MARRSNADVVEMARSPATTADARARDPPCLSLVELREPVSDPVDREQIPGRGGIVLELPADVLHVRVDRALVGLERHAVHGIEQLRTREHATRIACERREEL